MKCLSYLHKIMQSLVKLNPYKILKNQKNQINKWKTWNIYIYIYISSILFIEKKDEIFFLQILMKTHLKENNNDENLFIYLIYILFLKKIIF